MNRLERFFLLLAGMWLFVGVYELDRHGGMIETAASASIGVTIAYLLGPIATLVRRWWHGRRR